MLNRVMLIGNLGADPELRTTQSGQSVAKFSIATSEKWVDKEGEKQEKTEWHRIIAWGKLAEIICEYCQKGKQVFVEGKLQTSKWEDKEGVTRYTTEIVASSVKFLGGGKGTEPRNETTNDESDDGIPF